MRWGAFTIVLLAVCIVQPGFPGALSIPLLGRVDLFLTLALLCGFLAAQREALLGGWIVGLAMDLCGSGALGAHAAALGLAALAISRLREWLNGELWWVQILIGVVIGSGAALVSGVLNGVHERLWYAASPALAGELAAGMRAAIPAALLAALLIGVHRAVTSDRQGFRLRGSRP